MVRENAHFENLKSAYIFPIIDQKLAKLQKEHPNQKIFNLGIGDVGLPLAPSIGKAIKDAVDEMIAQKRGYGPAEGYDFLRQAIWESAYKKFGIDCDDVFVSSGTGGDIAALLGLFEQGAIIGMSDPTYPAYRDATILSGRKILFIPAREEDGFLMKPPKERADIVYICTPSNPTGVALGYEELAEWVAWAKKTRAILIIDNVYHAFASDRIPPSIYAVKGADEVAIEMRSFSKTAGFTGLRCSYLVVPKTLHVPSIHAYWSKWINIATNGIAYPIQKGALATFSEEGKKELNSQISCYKRSAAILLETLRTLDQTIYGGIDSPYLFWKAPGGLNSWEFFDALLRDSKILAIPGSGFGPSGEGFVRLSSFISETASQEASHALYNFFTAAQSLS